MKHENAQPITLEIKISENMHERLCLFQQYYRETRGRRVTKQAIVLDIANGGLIKAVAGADFQKWIRAKHQNKKQTKSQPEQAAA